MKDNKILKLSLLVIISITIIVLIKQNVVAKKEDYIDSNESTASFNLEKDSELVKQVYDSLTLLNNRVLDDELYRYSYFNINNDKHELSNEEKLYIAFENIYQKNEFTKEIVDDIEILKIDTNKVREEVQNLFRDESFDPLNINYKPSVNCGIINYLYTGQNYELKYRKCTNNKGIDKSKIENAIKDGNFIKLKIKSFYAIKEGEDYIVRNYGSEKEEFKTSLEQINDNPEEILNKTNINTYTFSFELKGDDYYLVNIDKN